MQIIKSIHTVCVPALAAVMFLTGCATSKYLPGHQVEWNGAERHMPLPVEFIGPEMSKHLQGRPHHEELSSGIERHFLGFKQHSDPSSGRTVTVRIARNEADRKMTGDDNRKIVLLALTLGLVPASRTLLFDVNAVVEENGRELYRVNRSERIKATISMLFPTAMLSGKVGWSEYEKLGDNAMRNVEAELLKWAWADKKALDGLKGQDPETWRDWLARNPNTLFRGTLLAKLAADRPVMGNLAWHGKNAELFPDYPDYIEDDFALLFVGPPGNKIIDILHAIRQGHDAEILGAQIRRQGGPYRNFSTSEMTKLKQLGFDSTLIAAMIEAREAHGGSATAPTARDIQRKSPGIAALVINNNSGQYMNPWTSDGVLAEWVDKAINADIGGAAGSAVGAAAGAYAAQKALENVPFGGIFAGAVGSKIGEGAGREMAINASGGEAYIRQTSDQSFRSLEDMARYISATYAGTAHYQDAVKAADAVYPGLREAITSVQ